MRLGRADDASRELLAPSREGYTEWQGAFASPGFRESLDGDRKSLSALLPSSADGSMTLGPGYVAPFRFTVLPVGARPVRGELQDGRVLYRDAYEGVDEIAVARPGLVEQFYLLAGPGSKHDFSWKVALPPGVANVDRRVDGLWFLDANGGFILRVPAPFYLDAGGQKRSV